MKLKTSWLLFAGASIVWGTAISDDLFAEAPIERAEMRQPRAPVHCLVWDESPQPVTDQSPALKTHTAAGSS
jgi:hypothetical protein